ncbi:MAG: 16S rRNA (guanine(527)-N(7))-methyltransferase RsmG [Bdellovibrionales bacterium]
MSDSSAAVVPQPNWRIETWFSDIPKDKSASLKSFFDILIKSNRTHQSISPKSMPFVDAMFFADSILALRLIFSDKSTISEIYDLGVGAGFPGLVGAILYPNTKFVLVDQDANKINFLTDCVASLGLKNVKLIQSTIESLPVGSISVAVSRGVSNISKLILSARKCVAQGGTLYHMKSENWGMEVADIPSQLCSVWSPGLVSEYRLPIGEVRFAIVKTEKIS